MEDVTQIQKNGFFKIGVARRATQTKTTKRVFSKKGRPQGNTNKNDQAFIFENKHVFQKKNEKKCWHKLYVSKKQIVVPSENAVFGISKELGLKSDSQIFL